MRCMVMIHATAESEAGVMPSEKLLREMTAFNEELVKAGVMLAGEGLHSSSRGKARGFRGGSGAGACRSSAARARPCTDGRVGPLLC